MKVYLNEESISWLSLVILNTSVIAYLSFLRPKNMQLLLILFAFGFLDFFYITTFLQVLGIHNATTDFIIRRYNLLFPTIGMSLLIQFAYFFPEQKNSENRERKIFLLFSILSTFASLIISIQSFVDFWHENLDFYYIGQLSIILILLLLFIGAIIKRGLGYKKEGNSFAAKSILSFLLPFLFVVFVIIIEILYNLDFVSELFETSADSFGLLGFHIAFVLIYINHAKQPTSFMVKIVGFTLVTILFVMGNLGNVFLPFFKESYKVKLPIESNSSLEFIYNSHKSYNIQSTALKLDPDLGDEVVFTRIGKISEPIDLPFNFYFFGKKYSSFQIYRDPFISLETDANNFNFPLLVKQPIVCGLCFLHPVIDSLKGNVFYKISENQLVVTWKELEYIPSLKVKDKLSVQIKLTSSGDVYLSYLQIPEYQVFPQEIWSTNFDLIGLLPGYGYSPTMIDFREEIPKSYNEKQPLVAYFYYDAKAFIHDRMFPLFLISIFVSIYIILLFPIMFSHSLISPLNRLMGGIREVNQGETNFYIKPQANDEIGFLTESFNAMVISIRKANQLKDEYLEEVKRLNLAYHVFFPEEFIKQLNKKSILDVKLGDYTESSMTILFSDLRSYTSLSEKMTPKQNFRFLNNYLRSMSPIIRKNQGFIDKYIGDAIMALFPRNAEDAIKSAIEMQRTIKKINRAREIYKLEPIRAGIGIHTGHVILGTIGEKSRMEGTVVSDAVNISSRLENLTKFYSSDILISMDTFLELDDPLQFHFRILDRVKVKGKSSNTTVVEIMNGMEESRLEKLLNTKGFFEAGIGHYLARRFDLAIPSFQKVLEEVPDDKASLLYIQRSEFYNTKGVPKDWEGVEILDHKFMD